MQVQSQADRGDFSRAWPSQPGAAPKIAPKEVLSPCGHCPGTALSEAVRTAMSPGRSQMHLLLSRLLLPITSGV